VGKNPIRETSRGGGGVSVEVKLKKKTGPLNGKHDIGQRSAFPRLMARRNFKGGFRLFSKKKGGGEKDGPETFRGGYERGVPLSTFDYKTQAGQKNFLQEVCSEKCGTIAGILSARKRPARKKKKGLGRYAADRRGRVRPGGGTGR